MMKKLKHIISLIFLGFGCFTFAADKVIITGEPVILEQSGSGMYTLPGNAVTTSTPYHYVTINGTNRVCFSSTQPNLGNVDMQTVNVSSSGTTTSWYCYAADPSVFDIQPAAASSSSSSTTTTTTTGPQ